MSALAVDPYRDLRSSWNIRLCNMIPLTQEQLNQSATNNTDLAMAHIRSGLCLSAIKRGGRLDDNARVILGGIIRQCSEALNADEANRMRVEAHHVAAE